MVCNVDGSSQVHNFTYALPKRTIVKTHASLIPLKLQSVGSHLKSPNFNLDTASLDNAQLNPVVLEHIGPVDTLDGYVSPCKNALALSTKCIVDTKDDTLTFASRETTDRDVGIILAPLDRVENEIGSA